MNLFEIDEAILSCIDEETGEVIDEAALDALNMERSTKIRNIACWIKDLKADAEALKAEATKMADRQKAAENKADSLKAYLDRYLAGEKVSTPEFSISYRNVKNGRTVIDDAGAVPEAFLRVKTEPDKTAISAAIKGGATVPGAHLEDSHSLILK